MQLIPEVAPETLTTFSQAEFVTKGDVDLPAVLIPSIPLSQLLPV
jgi:hypothetical protein